MAEKKALILHSGGADSTYMLILARKMGRKITPLMFSYGQKHVEELKFAEAILHKLSIGDSPPIKVQLEKVFEHSKSNLLKGGSAHYPGVHECHLPARNGIFLFTALGIAESQGFDEIWIGCDYSDRVHLFPDCYQEWVVRMEEVLKMSGSRPIQLKAPLLGLSKEDICNLLEAEGISLKTIYSGYEPPKQ